MEKISKKYLRSVKRKMAGSSSEKAIILKQLKSGVEHFEEENEITDISQLNARFGSPETIAESYLQASDPEQTGRKIKVKNRVLIAICVALGALALAAVILGTIYVSDIHGYAYGYWTESQVQSGPPESDPNAIATY